MKQKYAYHNWTDRLNVVLPEGEASCAPFDPMDPFFYTQGRKNKPNYVNFRATEYGMSFDPETACLRRLGIMDYVDMDEARRQSDSAIEKLNTVSSSIVLTDRNGTHGFVGFNCKYLKPFTPKSFSTRVIRSGRYVQNLDMCYMAFDGFDGDARLDINVLPDYFTLYFDFNVPADTEVKARFTLNLDGFILHEAQKYDDGRTCMVLEKDGKNYLFASTADDTGAYAELSFENGVLHLTADKLTLNACSSDAVRTEEGLGLLCIPGEASVDGWKKLFLEGENALIHSIYPEEYEIVPRNHSRRGVFEIPLMRQKGEWFPLPSDTMERVQLTLTNPHDYPVTLMLDFTRRLNCKNVGVVPILRDTEGNPTGIPMQISKNWHALKEFPQYLENHWSDAYVPVTIEAGQSVSYEYTCAYEKWGNAATASHSQLCLIGYGGSKGQWEQCALGSFGEHICYAPDLGACSFIADVRPFQVDNRKTYVDWSDELGCCVYKENGEPVTDVHKYGWTENVGGGEMLVYYNEKGEHIQLKGVRSLFRDCGPNLTCSRYSGISADDKLRAEYETRIQRCDDVTRVYMKCRYDFIEDVTYSRFAIHSVGSDSYNEGAHTQLAFGCVSGSKHGEQPFWFKNVAATNKEKTLNYVEKDMTVPDDAWFFFGGDPVALLRSGGAFPSGAWADKVITLRKWNACVNEEKAAPAVSVGESIAQFTRVPSYILELGVDGKGLIKKDSFVEAVVEWTLIPRTQRDFYGENEELREMLGTYQGTWKMGEYEAVGNDVRPEVSVGTLVDTAPTKILVKDDEALFTLHGGVGMVPVVFIGVSKATGMVLEESVNGAWVNIGDKQENYGNDYWQAHYDEITDSYELTYNVYSYGKMGPHTFRFRKK